MLGTTYELASNRLFEDNKPREWPCRLFEDPSGRSRQWRFQGNLAIRAEGLEGRILPAGSLGGNTGVWGGPQRSGAVPSRWRRKEAEVGASRLVG